MGDQGAHLDVRGGLYNVVYDLTHVTRNFHNSIHGREGRFMFDIVDCNSFTGSWGWDLTSTAGSWHGERTSFDAPMAPSTTVSIYNMHAKSNVVAFVGPLTRMGISGFNNLGYYTVNTPAACGAKYQANSRCRSFDHGARDGVAGECWLSSADRASAGHAYKVCPLYDYYMYELAPAAGADKKYGTRNTLVMSSSGARSSQVDGVEMAGVYDAHDGTGTR